MMMILSQRYPRGKIGHFTLGLEIYLPLLCWRALINTAKPWSALSRRLIILTWTRQFTLSWKTKGQVKMTGTNLFYTGVQKNIESLLDILIFKCFHFISFRVANELIILLLKEAPRTSTWQCWLIVSLGDIKQNQAIFFYITLKFRFFHNLAHLFSISGMWIDSIWFLVYTKIYFW